MGLSSFYYDFKAERQIRNWVVQSEPGDGAAKILRGAVELPPGRYFLLWNDLACSRQQPCLIRKINGRNPEEGEHFFVSPGRARSGRAFEHAGGTFSVEAEVEFHSLPPEQFTMWIVPGWEECRSAENYRRTFSSPETPVSLAELPVPDHSGFRAGAGRKEMPGRFGFFCSSGLLDCAMTRFGVINKMFLCGHPRYRKPYAWSFGVIPEEEINSETPPENLFVNHAAASWRRNGTTLTFSIAMPGVVVENSDDNATLSKLEFAGNYQYLMTSRETVSLDRFPCEMPENFLILFGCTDFPDVPLLLIFDRKVQAVDIRRLPTGQISSLSFRGVGRMTVMSLYGFRAFEPLSPDDDAFRKEAVSRARFWSRACMAYPIRIREYFRNDLSEDRTEIVQKTQYRCFSDAWNTAPLEISLLPPVLPLSGEPLPEGWTDLHFPTKYGPLYAYAGDTLTYPLRLISRYRKYPLRKDGSEAEAKLSETLKEFFDFEARFPDSIQSYAYPGAVLESYAYCAGMFNFMPPERRDFLAKTLAERMKLACDPGRTYTLLLTHHAKLMKENPETDEVYRYYMSGTIPRFENMRNMVERTEPLTGEKYNICYLNVSMLSSGELPDGTEKSISSYPLLYMENDWGIGITMQMLYTAALVSGDYSAVRKNWDSLKKTFRYFDVFHDWACMGAGYAEKGRTWIEGANFGAFTSYPVLAEASGDTEEYEYSLYLGAKMLALCLARPFAGPYFADAYGVERWLGNHVFQDEYLRGHNFQYVPDDLGAERIRRFGISLLTTDAVYPELFDSFRKSSPRKAGEYFDAYRRAFRNGFNIKHLTDYTYLIVNDAMDEEQSAEEVRKSMHQAIAEGRFLTRWHDIHRFENFLPGTWLEAQILAWLEMREQPVWLENWKGMRILDAVWHASGKKAVIRLEKSEDIPMLLRIGVRSFDFAADLDGRPVPFRQDSLNGAAEIPIPGAGTLTLSF